jgi:hypothetical protein
MTGTCPSGLTVGLWTQIDRQTLHSQLRSMINTSTVTLHTLPRLCQAEPENHVHSPQYEQSGLYIMVDPDTGKPLGGQLVEAQRIYAGAPQQENVQPGENCLRDSLQHSDQHTLEPSLPRLAAQEIGEEVTSPRLSVTQADVGECSGQAMVSPSGVRSHTEPIELLTPAFDHAQNTRFSEESCRRTCSVSSMPDLRITAADEADIKPGDPTTIAASHETNQGQVQDLNDINGHGSGCIAPESTAPLCRTVHRASFEAAFVSYDDALRPSKEEAVELGTEQVRACFSSQHS